MTVMIPSDIKLFWDIIYIIPELSNHLSYHRHKKINTKLRNKNLEPNFGD